MNRTCYRNKFGNKNLNKNHNNQDQNNPIIHHRHHLSHCRKFPLHEDWKSFGLSIQNNIIEKKPAIRQDWLCVFWEV